MLKAGTNPTVNWRDQISFPDFYLVDDGEDDVPGQVGRFPAPTITVSAEYLDQNDISFTVGNVIYAANKAETAYYVYVVKEYYHKTETYKLEWPD